MLLPPTRHRLWLLVALALAVAAFGAGVNGRADRDTPPAIKPYDPLHRW